MKKTFLIFVCILSSFVSLAQLATVDSENGEGMIVTFQKKPIDNIVYMNVDFEHRFAIVMLDDGKGNYKYGVYSPEGKLIIPVSYANVEYYEYNENAKNTACFKVMVQKNETEFSVGLIDLKGNTLLNAEYAQIESITDYLENSQIVYFQLTKKQTSGESLSGIADSDGKLIIEPIYKEVSVVQYENIKDKYFFKGVKNDEQFLFDQKGTLLFGKGYHSIDEFCGGTRLIAVSQKNDDPEIDKKYGFVNIESGKEVFPCIFDFWLSAGRDQVVVTKDERKGIIDPTGFLLEPAYDRIESISDSGIYMCYFKDVEDADIFNSRTRKKIDLKCSEAYENWPLLVFITPEDALEDAPKSSLYNLETNEKIPGKFDEFVYRDFSNTVVKNEGKWFLINEKGIVGKEIPGTWSACKFISERLLCIQKDNLFGLMKIDGQVLIEPKYEEVLKADEVGICVKLDGKYGMVNSNGSMIIPCTYSSAFKFSKGKAAVSDDSGSFYINSKNKKVEN